MYHAAALQTSPCLTVEVVTERWERRLLTGVVMQAIKSGYNPEVLIPAVQAGGYSEEFQALLLSLLQKVDSFRIQELGIERCVVQDPDLRPSASEVLQNTLFAQAAPRLAEQKRFAASVFHISSLELCAQSLSQHAV